VVIEEIQGLLIVQKLNPPYLFVAHSLGGVFANLYARTYPDQVLGIVFVEASHPLEIAE
jgi:pimeloyl-ACP methyl ester carboxylesterase